MYCRLEWSGLFLPCPYKGHPTKSTHAVSIVHQPSLILMLTVLKNIFPEHQEKADRCMMLNACAVKSIHWRYMPEGILFDDSPYAILLTVYKKTMVLLNRMHQSLLAISLPIPLSWQIYHADELWHMKMYHQTCMPGDNFYQLAQSKSCKIQDGHQG